MKVLISGDVSEESSWQILLDRLSDLQKSQNGPFDLLLFTGIISFLNEKHLKDVEDKLFQLKINAIGFQVLVNSGRDLSFEYIQIVPDNVGLWNSKDNLSIGYYLISEPSSQETSKLNTFIDHVGYRGCDFLVSRFWPMHSEQQLSNDGLTQLYQHPTLKRNNPSATNPVLPMFVNRIRPRYLFLSGLDGFYQRPPFVIQSSSEDGKMYCRLIALDQVSPSKDKHHKYLHALSLSPLIFMKLEELEAAPADATLNPFIESRDENQPAKKMRTGGPSALSAHFVAASSSSTAAKTADPLPAQQSGSSFFFSNPAASSSLAQDSQLNPFSKAKQSAGQENRTIFVGNLGQQLGERELRQVFPGAATVRKIAGKSFAFVEFLSHQEAVNYINFAEQQRDGLKAFGRVLTVKWATGGDQQGGGQSQSAHAHPARSSSAAAPEEYDANMVIPPNDSVRSVYVGNIPSMAALLAADQQLGQGQGQAEDQVNKDNQDKPQMTLVDYENRVKFALQQLFPALTQLTFRPSPHSSPTASQFAFVEFESQEVAKEVIRDFYETQILGAGGKYQLLGTPLLVKWPKTTAQQSSGPVGHLHRWNPWHLLDEQPRDCKVIFLGHLPPPSSSSSAGKDGASAEGGEESEAEEVRILRLKQLLAGDYGLSRESLERDVFSIHLPEGRGYAFLDCASPAAAGNLMRALLGKFHELAKAEGRLTEANAIRFGWAKGKNADKQVQSEDCWFCLASPTVKLHLVVSVGDSCYLALPKGSVAEHHILVIPIDCLPNRLHLSRPCKEELAKFIRSLHEFFAKGLRRQSFLFERSIRTSHGRDHMQIQMVPFDISALSQDPVTIFQQKASEYHLSFQELEVSPTLANPSSP
jgi:hypothetical protein